MVTTSATFRSWLNASTNMKLSLDASVLRVTHEGITSYDTLVDFDKASIIDTFLILSQYLSYFTRKKSFKFKW